jgi:hypothetical protein
MSKKNAKGIEVFLRVKPSKKAAPSISKYWFLWLYLFDSLG